MPDLMHKRCEQPDAQAIIDCMAPVQGEVRAALKCRSCGRIFGRRYVPYGLGRGLSVNLCGCQLTSNNVQSTLLLEARP